MNKIKSPEQRITIKIGLIFLVVILFFTGLFIYSTSLKKSIDKQKEEMNNSYRILAYSNRLIISIQQAQDLLNSYLISPRRIYQQQYDSISQDINEQIEIIKNSSPDKEQAIILEDIDSLLLEKNQIVKRLLIQLRSENPLIELDRKIETIEPIIQDSVVVTMNSDTTIVNKQRKDFWSRLSQLFDPKFEPDTVISITHTEQKERAASRVDTLMYKDLKGITAEATKTYSSQIQRIERQVRELVLAEQSISLHISQLITQFYNEAIQTSRVGTENSEMLTQKIFTFAITVGAISIVLILIITLFIANDLEKGKNARTELSKEKHLTENLIESRHKLLLSVSHDIKTPLSSIMGYMEIWDSEVKDHTRKKQIKSALNSGQHILSMLSNLLEFSRLEQKTAVLQKSSFNLIELIEDILNMFRPFTYDKNIELEFITSTSTPFYIETDYTVLKQIFTNIISNSVKYTINGNIKVELKQSSINNIILKVTDTGVGIELDDQSKIFKPFSRTPNPLKAEGSGFGLYVTKGLTETLNGEIKLTSEKNKGTQVIINLPIEQIKDFIPDESLSKYNILDNERKYNKVLIFEDDIPLGNLIKEFLKQKGFKIKLCNNSRDIKGFIRLVSDFDIVFTDMQLVDISGTEILNEIRKINKEIPVWLMTANDEYNNQKTVMEGFNGLISKPIKMSMLIDILNSDYINIKNETDDSIKDKKAIINVSQLNNGSLISLEERFPQLFSMFGEDTVSIKEILLNFVESTAEDTDILSKLVKEGKFVEAQHICHKIHPFLSQLGASHLTTNLIKMDKLRGNNESLYPDWKKDITKSISEIKRFSENIKTDYL